jgi:serine phosphatase RsbU (regulator of sigma subunit)
MSRLRLGLVWGFALCAAFIVAWGAHDIPLRGSYGWLLKGSTVMAVTPHGPAWDAGVRPGDVLREPLPRPLRPGAVGRALLTGHGRAWSTWITARPATADERLRALLACLLAGAFLVVALSIWSLRRDRLTLAFTLFALSAAVVLAPRPLAPAAWLAEGAPARALLELLWSGATLLLPAALVDFFARFPEGRPGRWTRRIVALGYATAFLLFALNVLGTTLGEVATAPAPAVRFVQGGGFETLAALFFACAVGAGVLAFVASVRRAAPHHRPRLVVLMWAVALGLLPLAFLTLLRNLAPGVSMPWARWATLSLVLVPLGFGYATIVHRVFDIGGAVRQGGPPAGVFGQRPQTFPSLAAVLDEAAAALTRQLGLEHCAVFAVDGVHLGARLSAMHGRPPARAGDVHSFEWLAAPLVEALALHGRPIAPVDLAQANSTFDELGTSLLVPLFAEERCRAILALGPRLSGPWFDPKERTRLDEFATQASALVENAALHDRLLERAALERDVVLARRIQDRLLPPVTPVLPTVDIAARTRPAQDIGGDYFDFLDLGPRQLGVAVADVCGKGLPAALLLASVQAQLRGRASSLPSPGALLARLNDELCALRQPEKFVCLAFARLDARRQTLTWANAGLNPPLVVHPDGRVEELTHGGLILGVTAGQTYDDMETRLVRGSVVAFYTDGMTDSMRAEGPYGAERLAASIVRHRHLRASRLVDRVIEESAAWHDLGGADDRTIVILKML